MINWLKNLWLGLAWAVVTSRWFLGLRAAVLTEKQWQRAQEQVNEIAKELRKLYDID